MSNEPLKLAVVVGSVREGRMGEKVAGWVTAQAALHAKWDVDVVDLADHPLPLAVAGMGQSVAEEVQRVKDAITPRLVAAEAFIVVTPEYNHSFPASLKNAIDWHLTEWSAKPVGLVSYGGMGGGLRAAEHLRQVFPEVHAMTIREMLSFHNAWGAFDGDEALPDAEAAAKKFFDQLAWWAEALRRARASSPYLP
ncbi:NADPH-dependent FMN reductase [Streptomyces johnsoniae]|uniref:NAD(P)H-dependent oxidoreductase n=1 Tax=Streptomyces johnsoniae TaxID=3075532 RepID=A0ABU2S6N4_9ACTN|nr:NAD(P)H-dependent oxidoreductase [Streptomyces sp. DSM 41886]MDT0444580.1 NAD(P)H-dependent oxidoreductase [Streptomyces sp. DSM 41886]